MSDDMYKGIAQALQSKGRFGDSELVHLNPKEVNFLRSMSPTGDLTVNPETGLKEAFLPALLPILGGVVGNAALGGTLGSIAATGIGSGIGGLVGSGGDLERGILSGLMGAAGAGIGGSLFGDGAAEATKAAADSAVKFAPMPDAGPLATPNYSPVPVPASAGTPNMASTLGQSPISADPLQGPVNLPTPAGKPVAATTSPMGTVTPPTFGERLVEGATDPMTLAGAGIAGLSASAYDDSDYTFPGLEEEEYAPLADKPNDEERYPDEDYRPGMDPEFVYFPERVRRFQEGGMVDGAEEGDHVLRIIVKEAEEAILGQHPEPEKAIRKFQEAFGPEALEELIMRVRGDKVSQGQDGAQDGMSDSIPGTIEGKEPVRLSEGEFIVPADVVSGLGDGSTEAGARQLEDMMNRVRTEKTGMPQQPRPMDSRKVMPS